ncbi:hypothetical protein K439DRAFT_1631999 [Ramaria rubella]|nr:hypothetical protein K439DRAFT_1631999 [Ramaria rubella]
MLCGLHGSSILGLFSLLDGVFALFTQWMVGSRSALYGRPNVSNPHPVENKKDPRYATELPG